MATSIQTALKNCISREVERIKRYDWHANSEDNVVALIGGSILGVAAVTLIANAGGIMSVPDYIHMKHQALGAATEHFYANHSHAIVGIGGSLVTAGALVFLKGLKEDSKVLRDRISLAFNKLGHGIDYIKQVEATYDAILDNNSVIKSEIDSEKRWISMILDNPTHHQAKILEPTGALQRGVAVIDTLKAAYIHGVKKSFAADVQSNAIQTNQLGSPSMKMEKAIIAGMLDYYVAADKQVPNVINKLHFSLVGDPEVLKSQERAAKLTESAINAILELKGKAVVRPENRRESRVTVDDFDL
jgi:hypothetical protein